uniref:Uncharacterized protein n=1 Tax=Ananas comosus var. bracteatus TaxID=296719 RepID=A0A6V7QRZ5_ANACO
MTAEASEYGGPSKVELEAEEGFSAESEEKDFKKGDGIAAKERAEDPIGGSFMIVNGDSAIVSEEDLDREGTVDPGNGDAIALPCEGNATPDINEKAIVGEEEAADHAVGEGKEEEMEPPPRLDEESCSENLGPDVNAETLLTNSENKIDACNKEQEEKRPATGALLGNSENEAHAFNKEDEEKRPETDAIEEENKEDQFESAENRELSEEQCEDKEAFDNKNKAEADEEEEMLDKKVCSDVADDHNSKVSTDDGVADVRVESDSITGDAKEADTIEEESKEDQFESAENRELNEEQCEDKEVFDNENKEEANEEEEMLDKKVCSDVADDHNSKVSTDDGVADVMVESDSLIESGDAKEADTIEEESKEDQFKSAENRELREEQCEDKEAFDNENREEANEEEEMLDKKVCSDVANDHNSKVNIDDGVADVRVESDSLIEPGDTKEADSQVAVELEANLGNDALKETSEEVEFLSTVKEMEESGALAAEIGHPVEPDALTEAADHPESATPDVVTGATVADKQSEEGTALVAEEPGQVCEESEEHKESEFVAHVEEKQGSETFKNKVEDQPVSNSAVDVEKRPDLLELSSQAQLESTTEGEEKNSENMVTKTMTPESHYTRQEESRSLTVVHNVKPDECSAESVTLPEVEVEKLLPTKDGSESLHTAISTTVTNEAESSNVLNTGEEVTSCDDSNANGTVVTGHSESLGSSKVSHSDQEELLIEVSDNTDDKLVQEAAYDDKASSESATHLVSAADGPLPSGHDLDSEIVEEPVKNDTGGETLYIGSMKTVVSFAHNDTAQENKVCGSTVDTNKDAAFHQIPNSEMQSSSGNVMPETVKATVGSVEGDASINKENDEESVQEEAEPVEESQTSREDPNGWATEGGKIDLVPKRQACYIIKVPRFINDELWTRIQEAQIQLDEKTQSRDSIRVAIQKKKMVTNELWEKLEAARTDERAARSVQNAKRREINNLQSTMSKLKKATSVEDIDELIQSKEQRDQRIESPTEAAVIKHGPKAELDEAFDHKDQIVERLGVLRKELESLGSDVSRAETNTKAAQKDYDDKQQELKVLQEQFKAADEVRQKAYGHWRDLKNESIRKSKYFFTYKDDIKITANYKTSGDKEALRNYCNKQVERIMELWNNNEDFRKHYIESNKNSTLRRLRTLDGRSLGPDEEPPILQTNLNNKLSLASPLVVSKSSAPRVVSEEKALQSVSERGEAEDAEVEKARKKEEQERARKEQEREEEIRREMAAAEKERCRLEQKVKAKEAEERKKRLTQRAQARAESRAVKEAELKDKKRAKKEKKKASVNGEAASGVSENDTVSTADMTTTPEIIREAEVQAATPPRRPLRAAVVLKQHNKAQPIPAALRNKGRRKMLRSWMWAILPCLLVLALFLAGNYISFSFGHIKFGN